MKRSEILRKAATQLWDGVGKNNRKYEHICHIPIIHQRPEAYAIRMLIMERLGDTTSLWVWLFMRGYIHICTPTKKIQAYRKAWCLHLADEYKSNGN